MDINWKPRVAGVLAAAMAALASIAAAADAPVLRVSGFGGSSNWPLFVAQDKDMFERQGLRVALETARDSASQRAALAEGRIDIAMTAFDNVVAWSEGDAGASAIDVVAFFGVNNGGRHSLMADPAIGSVAGLRGRKLAVDALGTGYAYVLQEMLRSAGLDRQDYELVSVGGSRERLEALRARRVAATLLSAPADAAAQDSGLRRLAGSADVIGRYQGSVAAGLRDWARANDRTLIGFIRAYVAAVDWLYDPAHEAEAKAILVRHQDRMKPEDADRSYRELLDPAQGSLARGAAFDLEGILCVLELRARYGPVARAPGDAGKYLETFPYAKAIGRAPFRSREPLPPSRP